MKTASTFNRTFIRSTRIYRPFLLTIMLLIICSFCIAACGGQDYSATDTSTDNTAQYSQPTTNNDTSNTGQNSQSSSNNGTGTIVQNFRCTSGISRGVIVPPYPDALHITFLQATTTANFVQDEITIQAASDSSNTFTWTLRSTGQQYTATISDPSIGAFQFGVTVLGYTQTLSMNPDTGQMQQASYWIAEVCDQWATDGTPVNN